MSDNATSTIFGIYNADATPLGETRYALSKVTGNSSCELCDITHGWNPFGKKLETNLQLNLHKPRTNP